MQSKGKVLMLELEPLEPESWPRLQLGLGQVQVQGQGQGPEHSRGQDLAQALGILQDPHPDAGQ